MTIPRAMSTAPIFSGALLLSRLSDGRHVVRPARALTDSSSQTERIIVATFVRCAAVEFVGEDGRRHVGRDADEVAELARGVARDCARGTADDLHGDLGSVAATLAFEIRRRWRAAS